MAAVLFLGAFALSRKVSISFIVFVRRCARPSAYVRVTPTGHMSVELCQAVRIAEGVKTLRESATILTYVHCLSCSNLCLETVRNELLEVVPNRHHILCINCLLQIYSYKYGDGANL
jgi:hypothetical protein